jgi:putative effector of murein hydrolase
MLSALPAFFAILLVIVMTLLGMTVPGLIIGVLFGYLFSRSFRFTRRISNDAIVGAVGHAAGFLVSIKWGYSEVVAPAGAVLLVLLHELYVFVKTGKTTRRSEVPSGKSE